MKFWAKLFFVFILCGFYFATGKVYASDLSNASLTLSTSRPSPSSPLSASVTSSDAIVNIFNNGSRFLASDSARIIQGSSGLQIASGLPVASQSASLTSVYLGSSIGSSAGAGSDILQVPITAMHTVTFTTVSSIPIGGKIVITYPGSGDNSASPSATTFAFNGLPNSTAAVKSANATDCNSVTVSAPTITCTTSALIPAATQVTIFIGCTAAGASCTTQAPYLINPTKSSQAGTADSWRIQVNTTDASNNIIDSRALAVGTIDSVTVRANVDPSLTFTIAGVNNGVAVNTNNTTGCLQTELTSTGINATATEVNLGTLANSPSATNTTVSNISAQLLTVTTNASNGYVITATSSGHLRNPSTGFFFTDATTPQAFPASGANFYGFHACGLDTYSAGIGTTYWNTTASNTACNTYITGSAGNLCNYGWPTATTAINIASDTTGPIGNAIVAGSGLTTVSYAAGADPAVPPGQYTTVVTYVATPSF
jgi:hypothetical protein